MTRERAPSDFYTGLVADLYEPLVSERARADDYVRFLDTSGTPALELACGTGLPLVELVERGYEVEGLDASQDMLDHCRALAGRRGVEVRLHRARMQSFHLDRRFRSIFLAGASFTLLTSDADAQATLESIHAHLEPAGGVLIPLEIVDVRAAERSLGMSKEVRTDAGDVLRVGLVALDRDADGRTLRRRLRYERLRDGAEAEVVERDWVTRSWTQEQFRPMLRAAGFDPVTFVAPEGGPAAPDASVFVALARRGPDPA